MATSGSITTSKYDGRYYKLAWERTGTSVANNTSTVKWTLSCHGGNSGWYAERTLKAVINGKSVFSKTSRVERYAGTIDSGTVTIKHNADGTKSFSMSLEVAVFTSAVNCKGSGTGVLTAIPRAATLSSATNFTDESNPTITYSNAAGTAVDSLLAYIYAKDDKTILVDGKTLTKTGTSFTFALTTAEITKLRDTCGDSKSIIVKFYIKTTIGGTAYWSSAIDKTFSIVNAQPTVTCSAYDSNPVAVALTGNSATIIKGFNAVYVSMTSTAKKGGTIVNEYITNNGKIHDITSGTITNVTNGSFSFYAEDNRGFTKTTTITLPMINYVPLTCNINAQMTAEGKLTFKANGNYFNGTFGAQDNSLELFYRYKDEYGEYTEWIAVNESLTGNANVYSYTGTVEGLDYQQTYTVQVKVKDKIKSVNSAEKKVNAYPVFDWGEKDFNFNVPISIQGYPVVDYVIEQGKSGIYTYRKWASGEAELWGRVAISPSAQDGGSARGGVYYCEYNADDVTSYPFTFVEKPYLQSTETNSDTYCTQVYVTTSKTDLVNLCFARGNNDFYKSEIDLYIKGRWK